MNNITKARVVWFGGNSGEYFLYKDKYDKIYTYDSMGNINYGAGELSSDAKSVVLLETTQNELEEFITMRLNRVIELLENYPCCMSCYLKKEDMLAAKDIKERFIAILKEELL